MDLLQQEINNNSNKKSSKKTVLAFLIFCIILLIIVMALMTVLKNKKVIKEVFTIDGVEEDRSLLIENEGKLYIPLESIAKHVDYKHFNGEYGNNEENRNKCYLQNENEVVGFEVNSKKIYKIDLKGNREYQYFNLDSSVIPYQNKLYIQINDLEIAFNAVVKIEEDTKEIMVYTKEYLMDFYAEQYVDEEKEFKSISEEYNNKKAIVYGIIVVNDGEKYGVIDTEGQIIIGFKYNQIVFDEKNERFIAIDNSNHYGVINTKGEIKIPFKYENIIIMQYDPLLYIVKQNGKYGVLDKDGKEFIKIEYDRIGYNIDNNDTLLIIESVYNKQDGLIVNKNGKYGIINIESGKIILDCTIDKINSKISGNKTVYYIQTQEGDITLEDYIKEVNTATVNL